MKADLMTLAATVEASLRRNGALTGCGCCADEIWVGAPADVTDELIMRGYDRPALLALNIAADALGITR